MIDVYQRIFDVIFNSCEPYLVRDFLTVRGIGGGNKKYCLFSCKKIFDTMIEILNKSRYNGEIVLPKYITFNTKSVFKTNDIIKMSDCYVKNKIIINNDIIKLANARESAQKDRILLIPIDGINSFLNGYSDFAVILILQQQNENDKNVFDTKNVSIFNPIRKDIFTFSSEEGCKYNGKKISFDDISNENSIDAIFVNNQAEKISFDLTKLSQISENLYISNSIFSSLTKLLTTDKNLCIAKIEDDILPFVNFISKQSSFIMKKIGSHFAIGNNGVVNKI